MSGAGYPMKVFVYGFDGRHSGGDDILSERALNLAFQLLVVPAMRERREVRIVDVDDHLVFHAIGGKVVWPDEAEATKALPAPVPFAVGDRVAILAGPYQGRTGRIARILGGDLPRAFVDVDLRGRETKARQDLRRLEFLRHVPGAKP